MKKIINCAIRTPSKTAKHRNDNEKRSKNRDSWWISLLWKGKYFLKIKQKMVISMMGIKIKTQVQYNTVKQLKWENINP